MCGGSNVTIMGGGAIMTIRDETLPDNILADAYGATVPDDRSDDVVADALLSFWCERRTPIMVRFD